MIDREVKCLVEKEAVVLLLIECQLQCLEK